MNEKSTIVEEIMEHGRRDQDAAIAVHDLIMRNKEIFPFEKLGLTPMEYILTLVVQKLRDKGITVE